VPLVPPAVRVPPILLTRALSIFVLLLTAFPDAKGLSDSPAALEPYEAVP